MKLSFILYLSRKKNCETERSERIKEGPISPRGLFAHEHRASIHSAQASILIIYIVAFIYSSSELLGDKTHTAFHKYLQHIISHVHCLVYFFNYIHHTYLCFFSYLLDCMKVIFVGFFSRVSTVKGIFFDVAADVFVAISWYGTHERFDSVYKILQKKLLYSQFYCYSSTHTHITSHSFVRRRKVEKKTLHSLSHK